MKRLVNYLLLTVLVFGAASCVNPEDPTPANQLIGSWNVAEYYVDGQADQDTIIRRFILERDGSFLLEDNNEFVFVGDWTSTDTALTLTSEDGTVFTFDIVFLSYQKMQILQTISNPTIGDITIRYLMNHTNTNTY
ncbi:MAG: hypothetical protein WBA74_19195 [Cyclobacteriaceae bacterium]